MSKSLADPLLVSDVRRIVEAMERDLAFDEEHGDEYAVRRARLAFRRDKALILVGLASGLHRAELAGIEAADLAFSTGGVTISYGRNKQVMVSYGTGATCPVAALLTWLNFGGPGEGRVFRAITRWGHVSDKGFTPQVVRTIVRQRAEAAGLPEGVWGAHSLRLGRSEQAKINAVRNLGL